MQKYKYSLGSFVGAIIASNALWLLSHSSIFTFDNIVAYSEVVAVIVCIALGVAAIAGCIGGFAYTAESNIPDHPKLVIDLQVEDVQSTSMKIPYGAKLLIQVNLIALRLLIHNLELNKYINQHLKL
jgi:hypothetical protein